MANHYDLYFPYKTNIIQGQGSRLFFTITLDPSKKNHFNHPEKYLKPS